MPCLAISRHFPKFVQRRPTYKVSFFGGRVALDLRLRGPLEAKSFVRAPKINLPWPREGSSILNVDLVVVTAAVFRKHPINFKSTDF
jgi:hypothetical protein